MQYVSLSRIPNKYPDVSRYTEYKERVVLLNGLYPERNKINFTLPEFKDITPIPNTFFRFVLAVAADENDTNPRLFTSKTFYDDIKLSYRVNNPYFAIQSLIGAGSVVTISLKDYFELFDKFEKNEDETPVNVTKNIFLSDSETEKKFEELALKEKELSDYKEQLNALETRIKDLETGDETGGRSIARRVLGVQSGNRNLDRLNSEKDALLSVILEKEKEIQDLKYTNTGAGLLSENATIDYEELVKFVDYMVSPSRFSVQEVENGNVRSAELLGKWEGIWIDAAKRRDAGETIEATVIDERVVENVVEEDRPKTVVGKVINTIGKLPVIKQVVGVVKAVGKFIGKLFSDSRLKTNIVKVGEIDGINIYTFRYTYDKSKLKIGVIAQELLNTEYKEFVSIDKETGYYVVNYELLQQKIDIIGAIKKIQSDINSKDKGFSKIFKSRIFGKRNVEFELENPLAKENDSRKTLINRAIQAKNNKKKFGTINIENQNVNSPLFKIKNKLAGKTPTYPNDGVLPQNSNSGVNSDGGPGDLKDRVLKRLFPKRNRR
jgi:hypothetical protein